MSHESRENPKVEIVEASMDDVEQIYEVQRASWLKTYPNDDLGITSEMIQKRFEDKEKRVARWRNTLGSSASKIWVAKQAGAVVGFCGVQKTEDEHRLSSIYIDPARQGGGIGSSLVAQAIAYLGREKDIVLDVVSYNENAIGFYHKHGFEIEGELPPEKLLKIGDVSLPETKMVLKAL